MRAGVRVRARAGVLCGGTGELVVIYWCMCARPAEPAASFPSTSPSLAVDWGPFFGCGARYGRARNWVYRGVTATGVPEHDRAAPGSHPPWHLVDPGCDVGAVLLAGGHGRRSQPSTALSQSPTYLDDVGPGPAAQRPRAPAACVVSLCILQYIAWGHNGARMRDISAHPPASGRCCSWAGDFQAWIRGWPPDVWGPEGRRPESPEVRGPDRPDAAMRGGRLLWVVLPLLLLLLLRWLWLTARAAAARGPTPQPCMRRTCGARAVHGPRCCRW